MATLVVHNQTSPVQDAEALRQAFKGWGADDKAIIAILGHRNVHQRQEIRKAYEGLFQEDLIKRLESEISGDFERAVYRWMLEPADRDAVMVNVAIRNGNKDYHVVAELACVLSAEEFLAVRRAYHNRYKHSLEEDVAANTSGDLRQLLVGLVSSFRYEGDEINARFAQTEANVLHETVKEKKGNYEEVIRILTTRSKTQLVATFNRYRDEHGISISKKLLDQANDDFHKVLHTAIRCINDHKKYYEKVLRNAIKKFGTDEDGNYISERESCVSERRMGWAIALHGGAGDIPRSLPSERRQPREEALRHCLKMGVQALKSKKMPPLDVVELVVRELENIPHFNAGRGSVLTSEGTVEMEASIMDGNTMKCGAVSGLTTVVNAISLARLVMEKTPHIYLAFDGAEDFARQQGVETVDSSHFITAENIERLKQAKEANRVQIDYTQPIQNDTKKETPFANGDSQIGTVGCVAVDSHGNLASATSTGGLVNKMVGRIGDTPVIGAGTYANELCAVSATGKGEAIICGTVARDVAALMEFKGLSLKEAATCVVQERTPKGTVGLVAVSATGEVAMPFNTTGMFRASATEDGYSEIAIWPADKIELS